MTAKADGDMYHVIDAKLLSLLMMMSASDTPIRKENSMSNSLLGMQLPSIFWPPQSGVAVLPEKRDGAEVS